MYESLHNHTTTSDGLQDHLAVLATAKRFKMNVIAFTDHDALPDEKTLAALKNYNGPVAWTVGIEISSGYALDHSSRGAGSLHIIGHFVDVTNKALNEHCRLAQEARTERMVRIVENLNRLGFLLKEEDCLRASGGESVGRPHIVSALLSYKENETRLRELMDEMAKDPEVAEQYKRAKEKAATRGLSEFVYTLLLGNEAYFPDVYVDYLYTIDMDKSVALIRDAGGVAIQAHWWTYQNKLPLDTLREYLINKRIDGIEIIGGAGPESAAAYPSLKQLAEETDCLVSVGADAHKPEDFERYLQLPMVTETKGIFTTLYEKAKPVKACGYLDPLK